MEDFEEENSETIERIINFKQNLEEKIQAEYKEKLENASKNEEEIKLTEIGEIKYYNEFTFKTKMKDLLFTTKDVYIVEMQNGDNITYEIYIKDTDHKIAVVNVEGKIEFQSEKLDDTVSLDELEDSNKEHIEEVYKKEEPEEVEKKAKNEKIEKKEESVEEDKKEQEEVLEDTEKNTEVLEEELHLEKGDIIYCLDVKLTGKDNLFRKVVKESREYDSVKLVYISSQDCFRFVGLKKGQPPSFLKTIEPSQGIMKSGMNINAENGKVEEQNISRVMKFTDSEDYDFSVKIGQYGKIELDMLRKDPVTNKYISTKVETKSERPREEQRTINEFMDKNKNTRIKEEIVEIEKEKNEQGENPNINLIDISDRGREVKEEIEKETEEKEPEHERTLEENVRKYYY